LCFSFHSSAHPRALHSFPTRRSSDLVAQIAERAGGTIPTYLMTSFATDEEVRRTGAALSTPRAPVTTFAQGISLRVTPEGALFRSEEHTSELQSRENLVCRLLLEKKK